MLVNGRQLAESILVALSRQPRHADNIVKEFIRFCTVHHLMGLLPSVVRHLESHRTRAAHQAKMHVRFARGHEARIVKSLKKQFHIPDDADAVVSEDPTLLGGFVVRYEGKVYDGSIHAQLARVRDILLKA